MSGMRGCRIALAPLSSLARGERRVSEQRKVRELLSLHLAEVENGGGAGVGEQFDRGGLCYTYYSTLPWGEEKWYAHREDGSPYLPDAPHLYLSISHTQGCVAVATSSLHPIGLDVEQRGRRVERVVDRYLTEQEQVLLNNVSDSLLVMHLIWSAKEAAYKLVRSSSGSLLSFECLDVSGIERGLGYFDLIYLGANPTISIRIRYTYTSEWVLCLACSSASP